MALRRLNPSKQPLLHLPRPFSSSSNPSHISFETIRERFRMFQLRQQEDSGFGGSTPPFQDLLRRGGAPAAGSLGGFNADKSLPKFVKDDEKKSTKTRAVKGIISTAKPSRRAGVTEIVSDERELEKGTSNPPPPPSDDPDARFPPPNHGEAASPKPAAPSLERLSPHISSDFDALRGARFQGLIRNAPKDITRDFFAIKHMESLLEKKKDDEKKSTKTRALNGITSTAKPSQRAVVTDIESDDEFQDDRELEKEASVHPNDDDLQKLDQAVTAKRKDEEDEQVSQISGADGAKDKPKKSPKKPKKIPKEDAMDFSITRCMTLLRTLEGVTPAMKVRYYDVFKCTKNCEIFVNAVAEEDGSALAWLQIQIGRC